MRYRIQNVQYIVITFITLQKADADVKRMTITLRRADARLNDLLVRRRQIASSDVLHLGWFQRKMTLPLKRSWY